MPSTEAHDLGATSGSTFAFVNAAADKGSGLASRNGSDSAPRPRANGPEPPADFDGLG